MLFNNVRTPLVKRLCENSTIISVRTYLRLVRKIDGKSIKLIMLKSYINLIFAIKSD